MRILNVVMGLSKAAGTSVFVAEISNKLVAGGHEITVAVADSNQADAYALDPRVRVKAIEEILGQDAFADGGYQLVHIHALWSPMLHRVAVAARRAGLPVVWSPHGMITPWAMHNKRMKKLLGWYLYQKRDLASAALLHATAQSEVEDIRRMGLKNKVVVAPLGVRIPSESHSSSTPSLNSNRRTLLFVSRVQRKKGLMNLVRAWSELPADVRVNWRVRIVGPDQENHTQELRDECVRLGVMQDFEFVGPKYGDELSDEYSAADLFVLPTFSENFGSVVIEALAHGTPVICTKGAPWQELEDESCGWWIDIGVKPLVLALTSAMKMSPDRLGQMGARGRRLVERKYSWTRVAETMIGAYRSVVRE